MHKNKTLMYGLMIIISVIDIVGIIICGILFAEQILKFNMPKLTRYVSYPTLIICGILTVICFLFLPIIQKKRQELRDEAEFDENSSKNKFSTMSKKERDVINKQVIADKERNLPTDILKSIKRDVIKNPEEELNKMIGLYGIKNEIKKMNARLRFEQDTKDKKQNKQDAKHNMHMMFIGNPGTGKTTVARIVASCLYQYGFIKTPYYYEIDGNFFNIDSTGDATKRLDLLCKAAKDSCIYIDEAYVLHHQGGTKVIASLVKQMEDNTNNIVFIFSGYKKEMQDFIHSNSGIESRIKYWFEFEDYNDIELQYIFIQMANTHGLVPDYDLTQKVIENISIKKRNTNNFGNARDIRTELDRIIDNHALNLKTGVIDKEQQYRLTIKDFI